MHHILRLFRVREFKAVITFGEAPIASQNRKLLAQELREKVQERFVPVT
jgi:hypothetical protein